MNLKNFFSFILIKCLFLSNAFCGDRELFKKLRISDKSFEAALLARSEILSGLIDVIEVDEKRYLVSVGICYMDGNPSPQKLLSAMKYSRIKAKEKIARLIGETVSSKQSFTSHYEEIVKIDHEGNEETIKRVKETFLSFTQSESQQIIHSPDQKELGWWITAEGDQMGLAIAYPIK